MIKSTIAIVIALSLSSTAFGQAASSTWPLTSVTTTNAVSSGNVAGQNESFGGMVINNYTGPNSSQRVTTTNGEWPAESEQNEERYIQFAVTPELGYSFTVTSVTMNLGAAGGGNMRANIWYSTDPSFATRTQLNASVLALPNGAFLVPSPNYSINVEVEDGETFYIRIYPWYTTSSTGKYVCPQDVVIAGTTTLQTTSFIFTSLNTLPAFGNVVAGGSSLPLSYSVSGTGLLADIDITAPAGFQLSLDSTTFTNGVTLSHAGGTVPSTTVYARFSPSSAVGSMSGNLLHTSTMAEPKLVSVSGTALASEPTMQSSVTFGDVTGNSIVVNVSGGNGDRRIVVARTNVAVSWEPSDGNEVAGVNSHFPTAANQQEGNRVVYDGDGSTVTITGLAGSTTYHVAVYEYNRGTNNSHNYNTTAPGTGSTTTLAAPTIQVSPASLPFGNVNVNTTSPEQTYSLSAWTLTPENGNIAIIAPSGFEVSTTSGAGFAGSITIPYAGGALDTTTIYVRFAPTSVGNYSGNISNSGGGANAQAVAVSGSGVMPGEPNVFQAEDGILQSAYVMTQYAGYTGRGYVDLADKTGSSLEIVFRRDSAATDVVTIYYANGASNRSLSVSLNDATVGSLSFPSTGSWTTWSSVTMNVPLSAGLNRLRFSSTTNNTNPNLDRIHIAGQAAYPMYKLTLAKSGEGTVSASPSETYYDAGTQVTLTASPGSGYSFLRWAGTAESRSNPYVLAMNAHTVAVGVMMTSTNFGSFPYQASPSGFASVGALGYPNGTTGGAGADSHAVYVTSATELNNLMLRRLDANGTLNLPPLTVYIVGILSRDPGIGEMLDVKDAYDLSIIGVGGDATITGFGLKIVRSSNIIVRNIRFASWPDDGINIQAADNEATGHHIWIDHCTFTDIPPSGYPASSSTDGALDVTHTAAYITLSWNRFENHDKTMLIGHSNSQTSDTAMKITVHHNWFNGTGQRHPRVRFGKVHVFNNHFSNNTLYGVSSNMEADVMVEGNYFMNVPIPTETSRDGGPPGDLVERYNIFVNSGPAGTRGDAFEPSVFYSYALDSASTIPAMLASYAGSGKYDFSMSGFAPSVVFGSFSGQAISGNVQLEWTTFSENNNLGFNVQRKRPADTVWTDLPNSFIPGQGTTTTPQYYSFTDSNVASGLWNYRLKHQEIGGAIHYTDAITVDVLTGVPESVVHEFALHQNYPNPFNPETSIRFTVAQTAMATLVVYNMLGQEVATLFNDVAEAGRNYVVQFSGSQLATGVYFYRLQSSGKSELRKFVLLK